MTLDTFARFAAVFASELNQLEPHDQLTVVAHLVNQAVTRVVPGKGRRMNARAGMELIMQLGSTFRLCSSVDQIGPLARCVAREARTLLEAAQAAEAREGERKAGRKRRKVVVSLDARRPAHAPATATSAHAVTLASVHAHPAFIGPPLGSGRGAG